MKESFCINITFVNLFGCSISGSPQLIVVRIIDLARLFNARCTSWHNTPIYPGLEVTLQCTIDSQFCCSVENLAAPKLQQYYYSIKTFFISNSDAHMVIRLFTINVSTPVRAGEPTAFSCSDWSYRPSGAPVFIYYTG